jgi:uncharacterized protein with beta-barrel porin domain
MFPGFSDSLKGDYDAGTAQVFGELGYGIAMGEARFKPFANLAHLSVQTDDVTETGGTAALSSEGDTTATSWTTFGPSRLDHLRPQRRGRNGQGHGGLASRLWRFVAAVDDAFCRRRRPVPDRRGSDRARCAVVEAGLDYALSPIATLGVTYAGQFGSDASDQSARVNLSVKF